MFVLLSFPFTWHTERELDEYTMKQIDRLLGKCFRRPGAPLLLVAGLLCLQFSASDSTPIDDSGSSSGSISSSGKYLH